MTRRRRKILICVAAVVVLVGFWQWWNWPRIESELIGTWTLPGKDATRLTLDGKGTAEFLWLNADSTAGSSGPLRWAVKRGRIVMWYPQPSFQSVGQYGEYWLMRLTGRESTVSEFEILERTPDAIRLRVSDSGEVLEYSRAEPSPLSRPRP